MTARGVFVKGGVRLALGLLAATLLWSAGACHKQEPIVQVMPLPNDLMDLPTLMEFIKADSRLWVTLSADCTVGIISPQIVSRGGEGAGQGNQVAFRQGRLQIEKPGKIRLEAVQSQHRILLVGDGKTYLVDMPAFGDSYRGTYGDPLPVQSRRILFMPDDLVMGWDWATVFINKAQVLKNLVGSAMVDSLELITEPSPAIRVVNTITFDRQKRGISMLQKFDPDATVRVTIMMAAYETVQGPDKKPVKVPSSIWLTYPVTRTMIKVDLHSIEINKQLPEGTFDLSDTTRKPAAH
jgi:outer membrane lipoprotein-sorting protein